MNYPYDHLMLTRDRRVIQDGEPYKVLRWDIGNQTAYQFDYSCLWCHGSRPVPVAVVWETYEPCKPGGLLGRAQHTQIGICEYHAKQVTEENEGYAQSRLEQRIADGLPHYE